MQAGPHWVGRSGLRAADPGKIPTLFATPSNRGLVVLCSAGLSDLPVSSKHPADILAVPPPQAGEVANGESSLLLSPRVDTSKPMCRREQEAIPCLGSDNHVRRIAFWRSQPAEGSRRGAEWMRLLVARAKAPQLAGEGDRELVAAVRAADLGDTVVRRSHSRGSDGPRLHTPS